jgi:hypothetical protein
VCCDTCHVEHRVAFDRQRCGFSTAAGPRRAEGSGRGRNWRKYGQIPRRSTRNSGRTQDDRRRSGGRLTVSGCWTWGKKRLFFLDTRCTSAWYCAGRWRNDRRGSAAGAGHTRSRADTAAPVHQGASESANYGTECGTE